MGRQINRYVSDYEHAGEKLVAICTACQRTALLSYSELNRRAMHMLELRELATKLRELATKLRCRNCGKRVAEVKLQRSFTRPPPILRH